PAREAGLGARFDRDGPRHRLPDGRAGPVNESEDACWREGSRSSPGRRRESGWPSRAPSWWAEGRWRWWLADIITTNLTAPVVLARAAAPHLRSGGAIVNVASLAGMVPVPQEAAYSASKAGLRAFS